MLTFVILDNYCDLLQTMVASKRNAGVPSAMVARQSLNDEELVSEIILIASLLDCTYV